jgi:hypothetical protein
MALPLEIRSSGCVIELTHADGPIRQVGNDFQLAAQRSDQPLQRADLHIVLRFKPRKRWLLDAKDLCELRLRHPHGVPNLGKQHFGEQFFSARFRTRT